MGKLALVAKGLSTVHQGYQARKQKNREAEAYIDASRRHMAATTREIAEEDRKKDRMHSRAVAVAAASGGGVDDPSIVQALGEINAEGEYRVMSALWSGSNKAADLQFRAEAAKREGKAAMKIGVINALTTGASDFKAFGGSSGVVKPKAVTASSGGGGLPGS